MFKRLLRTLFVYFLWLFVAFLIVVTSIPVFIYYNYRRFIYVDTASVLETDVAIVFGAAAYNQDTPSAPLKDRLETAYELYKNKKIKKLLLTGDNSTEFYNEPLTMKNSLIKMGVAENDVILDYAGFRTYDSCVRAKQIFKVDKALLISQGYHLPRALFTCKAVGIDATGVYSSGFFSTYYNRYYSVREIFAMYKAVIDVYIMPAPVVLGKEEPIKLN
jgi:vancomycin permeability regulator SanA